MKMIPRRHIVITGTGRAGTTFLIQLLTKLGLETGFSPQNMALCENARAGLELDLRDKNAPYVVKSPWFCDYAEEVLNCDDIQIDHVLVPMRSLHAAAESRRYVIRNTPQNSSLKPSQIPGGLWHTDKQNEQEIILLQQVYKLLLALSDTKIPLMLLRYPRITYDSAYLYDKLRPLLGKIAYRQFLSVFKETVRPDWVHSFNEYDR